MGAGEADKMATVTRWLWRSQQLVYVALYISRPKLDSIFTWLWEFTRALFTPITTHSSESYPLPLHPAQSETLNIPGLQLMLDPLFSFKKKKKDF